MKDDFRKADENGTVEWNDQKLELSVLHRTLAEDITAGKTVIAKAGTSIDQHVIAAIKANDSNPHCRYPGENIVSAQ